MYSPAVQDREQAARELLETVQLHGKRVSARLAGIYGPLLEAGETLPDYLLIQRLAAREMRSRLSDLLAAEAAYLAVVEQLEHQDEEGAFLRARGLKTEVERQQAIEAFDSSYYELGLELQALFGVAGEPELVERLQPRAFAGASAPPETAFAEEPETPGEPEADPVERRILSRKTWRPGLPRQLKGRIFRRRR